LQKHEQEAMAFESGFINNKRWIKGEVSIGKGKTVYVDTVSGKGVGEIINALNKFITYQASKMMFPQYTKEDVAQEIRLLALEAIPKYDNTRKTNMITFLQNHIRNRIINLCKFVSEKRRRATYYKSEIIKVKCAVCKGFSKVSEQDSEYTCNKCGHASKSSDSNWRKYNLPVVSIPFSSVSISSAAMEEFDGDPIEEVLSDSSDNMAFIREEVLGIDRRIQLKSDFMNMFDKLDETNKFIVKMIIEGYTYKDIAEKIGISEKSAYARASKIIKNEKIL